MFGVMRKLCVVISRGLPALAGLALTATAAAAFPLFAAAGVPVATPQATKPSEHGLAIVRPGRRVDARSAALEGAQIALSRVADGSTYLWYQRDGTYAASFKPTLSFRGARGELCRHLVMELSSQHDFRVVEGIACREANGIWRLEG